MKEVVESNCWFFKYYYIFWLGNYWPSKQSSSEGSTENEVYRNLVLQYTLSRCNIYLAASIPKLF